MLTKKQVKVKEIMTKKGKEKPSNHIENLYS